METLFEYLTTDFARRKMRNRRYSLRGYARYLGVNPTSLSLYLNRKRDISDKVKQKIILKLKLTQLGPLFSIASEVGEPNATKTTRGLSFLNQDVTERSVLMGFSIEVDRSASTQIRRKMEKFARMLLKETTPPIR